MKCASQLHLHLQYPNFEQVAPAYEVELKSAMPDETTAQFADPPEKCANDVPSVMLRSARKTEKKGAVSAARRGLQFSRQPTPAQHQQKQLKNMFL